jgi:hypothetical protein
MRRNDNNKIYIEEVYPLTVEIMAPTILIKLLLKESKNIWAN